MRVLKVLVPIVLLAAGGVAGYLVLGTGDESASTASSASAGAAESDATATEAEDGGDDTAAADTGTGDTADPEAPDDAPAGPRFDADPDGFGFRNYASRFPEGDLTLAQVRTMFGDGICTRIDGDGCVPHAKVAAWIERTNSTMNEIGHCVGFTVASQQIFDGRRSAAELGSESTFGLEREVQVLQTIAEGYASNYAANVFTQEVRNRTPSEIVDALRSLDGPADLSLFQPSWGVNGHSVLAHDVIDRGDGIVHIAVYDSNRPGEDNIVVVDTEADTWFYADAAVNPDQPSGDYFGDAESQSLSFIPLSAYDQPLECPPEFAELCSPDSPDVTVVTVSGPANVIADTDRGSLGATDDGVVETLEGGRVVPVRGELSSDHPPILLVPGDLVFSLRVSPRRDGAPISIAIDSPGFSATIDGLVGVDGQIESVVFDPQLGEVIVISDAPQQPRLEVVHDDGEVAKTIQLSAITFDGASSVRMQVDDDGDLALSSAGLVDDVPVLLVGRADDRGESVFASDRLELGSGTQTLGLGTWDGDATLAVDLDLDDDGSVDATASLDNQPVGLVVAGIGDPESVIDVLRPISTHVDPATAAEIAEVLPALGFDGTALGAAFRELPQLQPDDLASYVERSGLGLDELGALLFGLRGDLVTVAGLLEALELDEASLEELAAAVASEERVADTLDDWEYLNDDDASLLPEFLADRGLDVDDTIDFLLATELPVAELETVLDDIPVAESEPAPEPDPSEADEPAVDPTFGPIDPAQLPGNCSIGSDQATDITIVNESDRDVGLVWIDFDCQPGAPTVVSAFSDFTGGSFVGHVFVIVDPFGAVIRSFTVEPGQVVVVE